MQHEVIQDREIQGVWRVEAINAEGDGEAYVTIFSGPDAQERAYEYAEFKNSVRERELARSA